MNAFFLNPIIAAVLGIAFLAILFLIAFALLKSGKEAQFEYDRECVEVIHYGGPDLKGHVRELASDLDDGICTWASVGGCPEDRRRAARIMDPGRRHRTADIIL